MSNKITESGFYKLSKINCADIIVGDNLSVTFFDDLISPQPSPLGGEGEAAVIPSLFPKERGLGGEVSLKIGENSNVEFFGFFESVLQCNTDAKINVLQCNTDSKVHIRYLIYSDHPEENKIKIRSEISGNNNSSDVKILSIVGENGNINLDGIVKIGENIKGVKGKLIEENIFLGEKGKIRGIPSLIVESNDVEASHACKIEKISDEQLFYLRSRGIGKDNALSMIISAKIFDLFKCLNMINKEFYEELIDNILKRIK